MVVFKFLEGNFGLLLLAAFPLGLFMPISGSGIEVVVATLVSVLIFISCFKTEVAQLKEIKPRHLVIFWLLRFVIMGLPVYVCYQQISQDLALTVLLLTLMPAGVASPALSAILGGNTSLAFAVVIFSHLMCPLTVPLAFGLVADQAVQISVIELFYSLSLLVFVPITVHLPLRRTAFDRWLEPLNSGLSVLIVVVLVVLVTAMQRSFFLENTDKVFFGLVTLTSLYMLFYLLTLFASRRTGRENRLAYMLCSGANNNALAISVAALYFSPTVAALTVLSEIPWVLGVVVMRKTVFSHRVRAR